MTDMDISNVEELNSEKFLKYEEKLQSEKKKGQTINTKFESIRSFLKFLYESKKILAPVCEVRSS